MSFNNCYSYIIEMMVLPVLKRSKS